MSQSDGGPAFPRPWSIAHDGMMKNWWRPEQDGMTLRDWFAGMALQGMLAGTMRPILSEKGKKDKVVDTEEGFARCAYCYADAMLAHRPEPPT